MSARNSNTTNKPKHEKHLFRTLAAALLGFLAFWLLLSSIMVVWLNRTLTDTNTYVATVTPLIQKQAVQDLIAQKVAEQAIQNMPVQDAARTLFGEAQTAGKSPEQLRNEVQTTIESGVKQVLTSPGIQAIWVSTNRTTHVALIHQLETGGSDLKLDLSPVMHAVVTELKQTKLAPISDKLDINQDAGTIDIQLQNTLLANAHSYYEWFQRGTLLLVLLAVVLLVATIVLSVHHMKTLRRMLILTGVSTGLLAIIIFLPSTVTNHLSSVDQQVKAAAVVEAALTRRLLLTLVIISVASIAAAFASKWYEQRSQK